MKVEEEDSSLLVIESSSPPPPSFLLVLNSCVPPSFLLILEPSETPVRTTPGIPILPRSQVADCAVVGLPDNEATRLPHAVIVPSKPVDEEHFIKFMAGTALALTPR